MTLTTTTAAPARTDLAPAPATAATDAERASTLRVVRRAGLGMAVGAATWATSTMAVGNTPDTVAGARVQDLGGLAFQVGVLGLVLAMIRTRATGTSRAARGMLRVELVLLSLAMTWTVLHAADPLWADENPAVIALDAFWPLSMLGMFVIGIKVFRARRWTGQLRYWPMVAETWGVITVPTFVVVTALDGPAWVPALVGSLHLLVGYTRLGWLMHRDPELAVA